MVQLHRRIALSLAFGLLAAFNVQAQQGKPTRLVIFSTGGPVDFVARVLATKMTPVVAGPVIVDAHPGANGIVAAQNVISSEADGTSLLFASSGLFTITPALSKMPFDPDKDLVPVARVVINASAVVIDANIPANNVKEFVAYAKAQKDAVAFGTPGLGNITHLWIEQLNDATGLALLHIPYKGVAPAITDILGGRLAGTIADWPALQPYVKSGKMKALGLVGPQRSPAAPSIPTLKEQGYAGVEALSWYGVFAPAKTPRSVIDELSRSIAKALADPEIQSRLRAAGSEPSPSTPEELAAVVQADRTRWAALIKAKNISTD
ncbi:MAG: transporter substrate-binding protein [Rhizobacter sp.]|nr:transporter substrate-binding protein [Rhizobacter sp.]